MLKNYIFKHNCNNDNDTGRRKQQKLATTITVTLYGMQSANNALLYNLTNRSV